VFGQVPPNNLRHPVSSFVGQPGSKLAVFVQALTNLNYSKDYRNKTTTYLKQASVWRFGELCGVCVFLFHAKGAKTAKTAKKIKNRCKIFICLANRFF
jgi:hypothetical protein